MAGRWRAGLPSDRGSHLVGQEIRVWWKDEHGGRYYEGTVLEYDKEKDIFKLFYEEEEGSEAYDEKLDESWQVWEGPPRPKSDGMDSGEGEENGDGGEPEPIDPGFRPNPKATYADMIIQAIRDMRDKEGSSLWAIRKWMMNHYHETARKQKLSFNNLTKKAVQKLEAEDILCRNKGHYRFTWSYMQRLEREGISMEAPLPSMIMGFSMERSDRKSRYSGEALLALDHNKELRREWEMAMERRNAFLVRYRAYIEPFLPGTRNFFTKLEQHERNRKAEVQRRRQEERVRILIEQDRQREASALQVIEEERLRLCMGMAVAAQAQRDEDRRRREGALVAAGGLRAGLPPYVNPGAEPPGYAAYPPPPPHDGYYLPPKAHYGQQHYSAMPPQPGAAPQVYPPPPQDMQPYVPAAAPASMPPTAFAQGRPPQHGGHGQEALEEEGDDEGSGTGMHLGGSLMGMAPQGVGVPYQPLPSLDLTGVMLDGGPEVQAIMLKMGFIAKADLLSNLPLGISGKPLDPRSLLPPLEVNADGYLLMQDRELIGQVLAEGPFKDHLVLWPGSRVPLDFLPKESEKALVAQVVGWQQVYWLQRLPAPTEPPASRREPNVLALRLANGTWVPHRHSLMRVTQKFAEVRRIPLDNRVAIPYRYHHTGEMRQVVRDYCWANRYAEAVRRCFKGRVERDPSLFQRFQDVIDEYSAQPVLRPWHKQQQRGGNGGVPHVAGPWGSTAPQQAMGMPTDPASANGFNPAPEALTGGGQHTAQLQAYHQREAYRPQHSMLAAPQEGHYMAQPPQQGAYGAPAGPGFISDGGPMYAYNGAPTQAPPPQQHRPYHGGVAPPPTPAPYPIPAPMPLLPPLPVAPVAPIPLSFRASKACLSWLKKSARRVQTQSLARAAEAYQYLLDEGAGLPEEVLAPVRVALHAALQKNTELQQISAAAAAASSSSDVALMGAGGQQGQEEEQQEEEQAQAAPQPKARPTKSTPNPIDPLAGLQMLSASATIAVALHEHQVQGLSWLVHMYRNATPAILGDQMGLGKTLQSIALLSYLKDVLKVSGPHLVVAPLSVLSNWMSEIERFCPSMRAVRFHGPKGERNRIKVEELGDVREFDVVITTYEMLTSESNWFRRKFFWRVVIVDEGHRLKNEKSQLSESIRKIPAFYRVLLTGTPLQNNLRELWALFHYLLPDVFTGSTAERFEEGFDPIRGVIDVERMCEARALLSLFMLRRRKDQIKMTLPSKTELVVTCGLTDIQRSWYKRILTGVRSDLIASGKAGDIADAEWRKLLNILLQLRKVCNHPYLMTHAEHERSEELVEASGKLKILDRMLPKLKADGHRVLLFSQFTSMLDILEEFCIMRGHEYARLDGSTNRVQRRLDLRRFNAPNSQLFIFLISTRAGGQGINLASADTVVLYDSDWNPQVDLQAMERAHRIGQVRPVRVYRLVVRKSVEERMVSRAHKKLFLNDMVAEVPAEEEAEEEEGEVELKGEAVDPIAEMEAGGGNSATAKDEVARLIRTGVTALFEADGRKDISEDELDVLLGRKEEPAVGLKSSEAEEPEDEQAISKYWQSASDMQLEEVDLRHLEGVLYEKAPARKANKYLLPESQGLKLEDLELGQRKRKARLVMVDGKGTGYGGDVPVLADEWEASQGEGGAASSLTGPPPPKRVRRDFRHETQCFLCGQALHLVGEGIKKGKASGSKHKATVGLLSVRCGHCPKVYHSQCLADYTGNKAEAYAGCSNASSTMVCPQHKCMGCQRSTAAAGGLLFRCVECPRSYCEDCLDDDAVESFGRWMPMEKLGYFSRQSYFIRCTQCGRKAKGLDAEGEEGEGGGDGGEEEEAEEEVEDKALEGVAGSGEDEDEEGNKDDAKGADEAQPPEAIAVKGEEEEEEGKTA